MNSVDRFSKATQNNNSSKFDKKSRFCGVTELFGQERVRIKNLLVVPSLFTLLLLYNSPTYAMRKPAALEYVAYKGGRIARRYAVGESAAHNQVVAQQPARMPEPAALRYGTNKRRVARRAGAKQGVVQKRAPVLDESCLQEQDSLVHAVNNLDQKDVWRLLTAGVDPDTPNNAGEYALHEAVRSPKPESVDMVRILLHKKANPDIYHISTPFYIALIARDLIFENRVAKVQALIAAGAEVNFARVANLLNIKQMPDLAGEYYPGQPAYLVQIIKEELDVRRVMAELQAQPIDQRWHVTI